MCASPLTMLICNTAHIYNSKQIDLNGLVVGKSGHTSPHDNILYIHKAQRLPPLPPSFKNNV